MKTLTFNNINLPFTFENIYNKIYIFWANEIIPFKNHKKIWLTIIVNNNDNRKFLLINNLPFNTIDITDIMIVLKQTCENNLLFNRKDNLDSITIKFYFEEKSNYNLNIIYYYLFKYLIVIFTILCLIFSILYLYIDICNIYTP